ncbi:MAG: CTP synthase [Elusimicrobia bacterium]|nr:CTP synthase [Elusimicrobiota bacterium]
MTKYIFVTGGVVSSLGKGITAASLGRLLKARGFKVTMIKLDPYLNVDPGTMSPYQHGEVFVTTDGAETDLDLGHYERFLDQDMSRHNNCTTGKVYDTIIQQERRGEFLGKTVQVIPHVTNEIKRRIRQISDGFDFVLVEVGGTVGDIESLPFLEAIRQIRLDVGRDNVLYVHVTLIPYIRASEELKTKPTQHSVMKLREIGIEPDILVCRTDRELSRDIKEKLALFCSVVPEAVIEAHDVKSIYEVPLMFHRQGMDEQVLMLLRQRSGSIDLEKWRDLVETLSSPQSHVTIAVAGKYVGVKDAYKSIAEALLHGGVANKTKVEIRYVDVDGPDLEEELSGVHGILIPGGFGDRGIEGKINSVRIAREQKIPFFGICLGMQVACIEFARNVLNLRRANSTEFDAKTPNPIISLLEEQKKIKNLGGTMRLGLYPCHLNRGTLAYSLYGKSLIQERHRHRFEFNNHYRKNFAKHGMRVVGEFRKNHLPEIVELKGHPFFIGVQFHPEFQSRPLKAHPIFQGFVSAALKKSMGGL